MSHPKSGPKIHSEEYCDALKIAQAPPRSAVGNQVATMRPLPGKTGVCARPEANRMTKIALKTHAVARCPVSPMSNADTDQQTILIPQTRLEPKRSSNPPEGNWPSAYAQLNPEKRMPSFTGSSANSFSIAGPAKESATRSP